MADLSGYSDSELIGLYGSLLEELRCRGIIRSSNVVGDFGEFIVVEKYHLNKDFPNLYLTEKSQQHFDAISHKGGKRYSIKTTTSGVTGVIRGLGTPEHPDNSDQLFDYLVICHLSKDYRPLAVYELDWKTFLEYKRWHKTMNAWNISLSSEVISKAKVVYKDNSDTAMNPEHTKRTHMAGEGTSDTLT